jgi:uncharacterized LabA/DUF88 family protein
MSYLNALKTLPMVEIHFGSFQVSTRWMHLVQPLEFRPHCTTLPFPAPMFANVNRSEEKGSDVNLGAHLVRDALKDAFEHAVVITNDTDLFEPMRIVTKETAHRLTLLSPVEKPAGKLKKIASHVRFLKKNLIRKSQFPDSLTDSSGRLLNKPSDW